MQLRTERSETSDACSFATSRGSLSRGTRVTTRFPRLLISVEMISRWERVEAAATHTSSRTQRRA